MHVLTSTCIPTVTWDTQGGIRVTSLASVLSDLCQLSAYREPAAQVLMTANAQWTRASVSAPPNGAARGSFGLRGVKLPHRKEKSLLRCLCLFD